MTGATATVMGSVSVGLPGSGGSPASGPQGVGSAGNPGSAGGDLVLNATTINYIAGNNYPPTGVQCRIVCDFETPSAPTSALALDPDGDIVSYALVNPFATGGVATQDSNGVYVFTPNPGFSGWTAFQILATDLGGHQVNGYAVVYVAPGVPACVADVDDGSGTGTPDGGVTIDDLLYYLNIYNAGSLSADVDDGSGTGTPDGGVTIDDLLYYLTRYNAGC